MGTLEGSSPPGDRRSSHQTGTGPVEKAGPAPPERHGSVVRCYYDPGYFFPLPAEHPFPMDKFWRSEALLRESGRRDLEILSAPPATLEQLQRVHTAAYLEQIASGSLDHAAAVRLGLPAGPELLLRSRREVGGTIAAAHAAWERGCACNLAGGTHHAFADRGLGYCVLNDVATAIRDLEARHGRPRILVLDTDAHQGNGTHGLLAGEPHLFTYSIHVGRNYPAVKTPGTMDVELPRYASGTEYLEQLKASLGVVTQTFTPDLVFWIAGADVHERDRFGQLRLTDADIAARDQHILELARQHGWRLVALYGGGYNVNRLHTARIHAQTVLRVADAAANGVERAVTPARSARAKSAPRLAS